MIEAIPDLPAVDRGSPADDTNLVTPANILGFLKRSIWTLAGSLLIALAIALAYIFVTPPGFIATTQLVIRVPRSPPWRGGNSIVALTIGNSQMETQLQILKSTHLARQVVRKLHLATDPEFRGKFAHSSNEDVRGAVGAVEKRLSVDRVGQSYVIDLSFLSRDPKKAARIANAFATTYLDNQIAERAQEAQHASGWMQQRLIAIGDKLNSAAQAVQKFKSLHGIVSTGASNAGQAIFQYSGYPELLQLETRAQAYRKLYESLLERLTEGVQQESFPASAAYILTKATQASGHSYPRAKLILALALILGLIIGMGTALLRDLMNDSVRSARQIQDALGLECFGLVPQIADGKRGSGPLPLPISPVAEALRAVKISLDHASPSAGSHGRRRLGIFSLLPGEGTSTLAIALASLFANSGANTLLVEGNFRHPTISRRLVPHAKCGILELLRGASDEAIVFSQQICAYVLPLAPRGALANSADLFGAPAMGALLDRLNDQFPTILIDLPPLSDTVDARAIAPFLDGGIIVVEWGRSSLDRLKEMVEHLRSDRLPLFGVIVNKVDSGIPPLFGLRWEILRARFTKLLLAGARGRARATR